MSTIRLLQLIPCVLLLWIGEARAQLTHPLSSTVLLIDEVVDSSRVDKPWEILWGPDDRLWMTDGPRIVRWDPATDVIDTLLDRGRGNGLGMVLHPDFPAEPTVLAVFDTAEYYAWGQLCEVSRFMYDPVNDVLTDEQVLFTYGHAGEHAGGRLIFDGTGHVLLTTAATLRAIASSTVLDGFETWNLDMPNGTDALLDGYQLGADFVTLTHNGQGEHLWTCTNGQSFTTGTVTFTFDAPGSYVVTHTYHDPCGNSDTRTFTFDMTMVGVDERERDNVRVHAPAPGQVEVQGAPGGLLTLHDVQGRTLVQQRISGERPPVACPPGMVLWRFVDAQGGTRSGKVMVW